MSKPTIAELQAKIAKLEANQMTTPRHAPNGDFHIKVQRARPDGTLQDLGVITANCLTYSKARGLSGLINKRNEEFHADKAEAPVVLEELGALVFTAGQAAGRDAEDEDFFSAAPKRNFDKGADTEAGFRKSTITMPS